MLIKLTQFAEKVGLSRRTIFKLIEKGELKPFVKKNNHNYFTEEQVEKFLGIEETDARKIIAYARVSSNNQKKELETQLQLLETFSLKQGVIIDEYISEIGSGINFKRPKFLKLVSMILNKEVKVIYVTYQDRLVRFAYELIEYLCEIYGTEIKVINIKTTSPQEELVEDLMTIIHVFSSRLYGLRRNKTKIKEMTNENS